MAQTVLPALAAPSPTASAKTDQTLQVASLTLPLPGEDWTATDINSYAETCLADPAGHREFGDTFRHAAETWRASLLARLDRGEPLAVRSELGAIRLGPVTLLAINAEIFSRFTELAASGTSCPVYTVSCANGMIGYIPPAEAYDEGAYEVAWSMFFYNAPRPQKNGLELLACEARRLIAQVGAEVVAEPQ